ncbi:hypothetical protein [Pseudomonas sp. BF-RE-26]|uniref:hypothetical protein n=1 Tax=Pseudomonas sp. BF-RE-26 TaxID=2832396 RepID=UPI001CBEB95B|nr:hypothetical protein [Pseudomonas sp. BF-RE-26]
MPITAQQLLQILPSAGPVAGVFVSALNDAMARFKIDGRLCVAAFLAQVGHESGQLRTLVENLNYSAEGLIRTWPKRFNLLTATNVARKPEQSRTSSTPRGWATGLLLRVTAGGTGAGADSGHRLGQLSGVRLSLEPGPTEQT